MKKYQNTVYIYLFLTKHLIISYKTAERFTCLIAVQSLWKLHQASHYSGVFYLSYIYGEVSLTYNTVTVILIYLLSHYDWYAEGGVEGTLLNYCNSSISLQLQHNIMKMRVHLTDSDNKWTKNIPQMTWSWQSFRCSSYSDTAFSINEYLKFPTHMLLM